MKICIFPGTFNPIHNAHIKMAEFAVQKFGFDKVIFIPAYLPPHKELDENLTAHRLNMVKLAIANKKNFEVSDIEYQSQEKSYTIFTVKKLIKKYNIKKRLDFIIGTDAFIKLNSWYDAEGLKPLVHFLVFPRRGSGNSKLYSEMEKQGWSFEIVDCDFIDISSTEIRGFEKLKYTDKNVEGYIKEYGLYES